MGAVIPSEARNRHHQRRLHFVRNDRRRNASSRRNHRSCSSVFRRRRASADARRKPRLAPTPRYSSGCSTPRTRARPTRRRWRRFSKDCGAPTSPRGASPRARIGRIERRENLPSLEPMLTDPSPVVRAEAFNAIAQIAKADGASDAPARTTERRASRWGCRDSIRGLTASETDPVVRGAMARTLGRLPYPNEDVARAATESIAGVAGWDPNRWRARSRALVRRRSRHRRPASSLSESANCARRASRRADSARTVRRRRGVDERHDVVARDERHPRGHSRTRARRRGRHSPNGDRRGNGTRRSRAIPQRLRRCRRAGASSGRRARCGRGCARRLRARATRERRAR